MSTSAILAIHISTLHEQWPPRTETGDARRRGSPPATTIVSGDSVRLINILYHWPDLSPPPISVKRIRTLTLTCGLVRDNPLPGSHAGLGSRFFLSSCDWDWLTG